MMIRGQKVVLREKRPEDVLQDYRWRTDEELARLDASAPLQLPLADYQAFYYEDLHLPDPVRSRFAIETLEGKHIGNCTYYDIDHRRRECQVGIMIGERAYWNLGYGADAMATLVDYIFSFSNPTFDRVYLETLDWNSRAQRCFQKVGFVPCGRQRRTPHTFIVMEIHRQEWQPQLKEEHYGNQGKSPTTANIGHLAQGNIMMKRLR